MIIMRIGVAGTETRKFMMSFAPGRPRFAGVFLGVVEGFLFFIGLGQLQ